MKVDGSVLSEEAFLLRFFRSGSDRLLLNFGYAALCRRPSNSATEDAPLARDLVELGSGLRRRWNVRLAYISADTQPWFWEWIEAGRCQRWFCAGRRRAF